MTKQKPQLKPTKFEIDKGLKQLRDVGILDYNFDLGYKFSRRYKNVLLTCDYKKQKEAIILEALWKCGYFEKGKTEREIEIVCQLLLLQAHKPKAELKKLEGKHD